MQTFYRRAAIHHSIHAVFRVPTRDAGEVFMCIDRANAENDQRAVVEVRADKFLDLWRKDPFRAHAEIANGNPSTWVSDYKYAHAVDGFSRGGTNPVPLAEVGCGLRREAPAGDNSRRFFGLRRNALHTQTNETFYVTFTNGITRTLYLLANGAAVFPVTCSLKDAELLQRLAGVPGGKFQTVEQIIPPPAAPLDTFAGVVLRAMNEELFAEILRTFHAAAYAHGFMFLAAVQNVHSVQMPSAVLRALADVVLVARRVHVAPRSTDDDVDAALTNGRGDGYGDEWVRGILKALAAQGLVPVPRTKLDYPPPPASLDALDRIEKHLRRHFARSCDDVKHIRAAPSSFKLEREYDEREALAKSDTKAWLASFDPLGRYYDLKSGFWESLNLETRSAKTGEWRSILDDEGDQ
ncbi:hypothetical protein [Burkholderia sp. 4M9327F10]|uniref:plasmid fertility inhibition factor family protein n=1 Tax=Burkholderia sp. 4M9327F10 TaxID=2502223 RepID=UPI0010F993F6|nr:hypothetical protein [Burkholderia sp. 4M9327F10]